MISDNSTTTYSNNNEYQYNSQQTYHNRNIIIFINHIMLIIIIFTINMAYLKLYIFHNVVTPLSDRYAGTNDVFGQPTQYLYILL